MCIQSAWSWWSRLVGRRIFPSIREELFSSFLFGYWHRPFFIRSAALYWCCVPQFSHRMCIRTLGAIRALSTLQYMPTHSRLPFHIFVVDDHVQNSSARDPFAIFDLGSIRDSSKDRPGVSKRGSSNLYLLSVYLRALWIIILSYAADSYHGIRLCAQAAARSLRSCAMAG